MGRGKGTKIFRDLLGKAQTRRICWAVAINKPLPGKKFKEVVQAKRASVLFQEKRVLVDFFLKLGRVILLQANFTLVFQDVWCDYFQDAFLCCTIPCRSWYCRQQRPLGAFTDSPGSGKHKEEDAGGWSGERQLCDSAQRKSLCCLRRTVDQEAFGNRWGG